MMEPFLDVVGYLLPPSSFGHQEYCPSSILLFSDGKVLECGVGIEDEQPNTYDLSVKLSHGRVVYPLFRNEIGSLIVRRISMFALDTSSTRFDDTRFAVPTRKRA